MAVNFKRGSSNAKTAALETDSKELGPKAYLAHCLLFCLLKSKKVVPAHTARRTMKRADKDNFEG